MSAWDEVTEWLVKLIWSETEYDIVVDKKEKFIIKEYSTHVKNESEKK